MNASNEAVNDATLAALVTGVSSGIGRETAGLLAEQGFRVFGTARNLTTTDPIAGGAFYVFHERNNQNRVRRFPDAVSAGAGGLHATRSAERRGGHSHRTDLWGWRVSQ